MDTSEDRRKAGGRRGRSRWTVGAGAVAVAGLTAAIFAGVANADETSTGTDGAGQEHAEPTPDAPTDGRSSDTELPGRHGDAGDEGMRSPGPRHDARPDGMQPGDQGECDEQHAEGRPDERRPSDARPGDARPGDDAGIGTAA